MDETTTWQGFTFSCITPYKRPKILVSAVAFLMEKPYRDPAFYAKICQGVVRQIKKRPNTLFRLYHDSTLYLNPDWLEALKFLRSQSCVQLVEFSYPAQQINPPYHQGVFGTLVRLIPCAAIPHSELPEWAGSPPTSVTVTLLDADARLDRRPDNHFWNLLAKAKGDLVWTFPSTLPRHQSPFSVWIQYWALKETRFPLKPLIALFERPQLMVKAFQDFLKSFPNDYEKKTGPTLEKYNIESEYTYGVDEFFLNQVWWAHYKPSRNSLMFSIPFPQHILSYTWKSVLFNLKDKSHNFESLLQIVKQMGFAADPPQPEFKKLETISTSAELETWMGENRPIWEEFNQSFLLFYDRNLKLSGPTNEYSIEEFDKLCLTVLTIWWSGQIYLIEPHYKLIWYHLALKFPKDKWYKKIDSLNSLKIYL